MSIYSRKQYMEDYTAIFAGNPDSVSPFNDLKPQLKALHRKYYAQFVSSETIYCVVSFIGKNNLLAAKDIENLNDIPLHLWEKITPIKTYSFEKAGDYSTLSNNVCVSKEAARQWIESQRK